MKYIKFANLVVLSVLFLTECSRNSAPLTPEEPVLFPYTSYIYPYKRTLKAATIDPNGDDISYQFDWGNGNLSSWSDFIPSGDTISESYNYPDTGNFQVRVRAQDEKEALSVWSEPISVPVYHP